MTIKRISPSKWEIRVSTGSGEDRRQLRKTVHGSHADAKRVEAQMMLNAHKPIHTDSSITLREYIFERWLPIIEVSGVTERIYKQHMIKVCEDLGHIKLNKLTPEQLERYFSSKESRGMARKEYETLRTALNAAIRFRLLDVNPCSRMQAPRKPHTKTPEVYSPQEVQSLMDAIRGQWWEPLWLLGVFCGLRQEEATALNVPPRDWDGALEITQAYSWQGDQGWLLTETKTEASSDKVFVPREIVNRILEITEGKSGPIASQPYMEEGYRANRLSFTREYRKFCAENSLRYIPPKNLRHTAATLMLTSGVDLPVVSKVLRHTKISTTANSYLGIIDGAKKNATDTLFERIQSASNTGT